jgi:uncharacterized membrane protein YedE/YeeE
MRLDPGTIRSMQAVSGLGCSIVVCLGGSILAGSWADQRLHTRPILVLVGILIGLIGSAAIIYNLAVSLDRRRNDGNDKHAPPNGSA